MVKFFLSLIAPGDCLSILELIIQNFVVSFENIHLEDRSTSILLARGDLDLSNVVVQLLNRIIQHDFNCVQLSPHRVLLLSVVATD